MEFIGDFKGISIDWETGKKILSFETRQDFKPETIEDIKNGKLSISAKRYRAKRSLDANGMLWACLGKMAETLHSDKWDVYLQMLKRYGKYTYICVKPSAVEAMKAQWRECEVVGDIKVNGKEAVQMLCYFGSSTYDSKEFSVLLDGVISEMKEMGLQIPPSEDMRRALEQWQKQNQ